MIIRHEPTKSTDHREQEVVEIEATEARGLQWGKAFRAPARLTR